MEYIERETLISICEQIISDDWNKRAAPDSWADAYECFMKDVKDQPTADVAEVVRCKNCKNYELMKSGNSHFCNEFGGRVTEEDFCSRAQRMDGGNNNA